MSSQLPIEALRAPLVAACGRVRRLVLRAPTGSGKSTQIPQMLIDLKLVTGQVVVLQPRRIAARMLASRIASERQGVLGGEVGYHIRFDRVESAATRIKFVTEALLLRQMASDPDLKGVGALVFDEFHERNLHADVALALARQLQATRRPDLLLLAMSATLDTETLSHWLGEAETLAADGRTYPVEVEYVAQPRDARRGPWEGAAEQVRRLLREEPEGDVLVFMPGAYEISRTLGALRDAPECRGVDLLPLHGDLPAEEQDRAVRAGSRRKVVVATNVAETSLTLPGIRAVVDAGLARVARFDPVRGIDTLLTEPVSQASAEQRAGRAGRTGPGRALRLWSKTEHEARAVRQVPEIRRVDLCETVLLLRAGGWGDPATFAWFEAPEPRALARATQTLTDLGALNAAGTLTDLGRRMAAFPAHPRHSRMLLAAAELGCVAEVARIAGLAQGRDILLRQVEAEVERAREAVEAHPGSDFLLRLALLNRASDLGFNSAACERLGIHAAGALQAHRAAEQFLRLARAQGLPLSTTPADPAWVRRCILLGLSDRVAVRLDQGTLRCAVVHGRRGELRRETAVREAPLLVAAEIEEVQVRGEVTTLLSQATAIEESWLRELFPQDFSEVTSVRYDANQRRVVTRVERRFRDLVLAVREREDVTSDAASQLLAEEVLAGRLSLDAWDTAAELWVRRVNFLARHVPEFAIPIFDQAARRMVIEQVCAGALSARDLRDRTVLPGLQSWLTDEQAQALEVYCPLTLLLPRKKHPARIDYTEDGEAVIEATVQELYDFPGQRLRVCKGRVPLVICIQSPARRTQQRTTDLDAFWSGSYELVKKELRGRYPKHEWR